jgi:hypothetical protein
MLVKAAENGQLTGLLHGFGQAGVICMQCADDSLLSYKMTCQNL